MMKTKSIFLCVAGLILMSSCSHLPAFMRMDPEPTEQAPKKEVQGTPPSVEVSSSSPVKEVLPQPPVVKSAPVEVKPTHKEATNDLELKLTRLWARVDELEQTISLQEQRIFLLQKGLMTGVVPNELLQMDGRPAPRVFEPSIEPKAESSSKNGGHQPMPKESNPPVQGAIDKDPAAGSSHQAVARANLTDDEQKEYQKKLTQAQAAFEAQQYGRAITLYEKIGMEYADGVTGGNHLYWVGLCWFYLKNYDVSRKSFISFMDNYKTSPMMPRAKYYMAKTEYAAGFVEKSVARLNGIIKEYPNDEISETARWEIKKIEEKL